MAEIVSDLTYCIFYSSMAYEEKGETVLFKLKAPCLWGKQRGGSVFKAKQKGGSVYKAKQLACYSCI